MTELQNQLNSQTLGDVLPSAFKQVGSNVFPDFRTNADLGFFREIVHSWAATHSPLFGSVVPSTGTAYSVTAASTDVAVDLVAPAAQEVIQINAISVTNGGGAPATVLLKLGSTLLSSVVANPSSDTPVVMYSIPTLAKGQTMTITVSSGTATDITGHASGVMSSV